jgi:hypothetical protein
MVEQRRGEGSEEVKVRGAVRCTALWMGAIASV